MEDLKKRVAEMFDKNPTLTKLFSTEDGQVFIGELDAHNHSQRFEKKTYQTHVREGFKVTKDTAELEKMFDEAFAENNTLKTENKELTESKAKLQEEFEAAVAETVTLKEQNEALTKENELLKKQVEELTPKK